MSEPPPLWIVFPSCRVDDLATQGAAAWYIDLIWLPFWLGLDHAAKDDYLDRWNAVPEWREAIGERYDPPAVDAEEDARESLIWRGRDRAAAPRPKNRWWSWRGRR